MRWIWLIGLLLLMCVPRVMAQTETPTPEPTATYTPSPTPTDEPSIYATTIPVIGTPDGQMTRFDYTATAGDVHIANLLTYLLYSVWAFFLFAVLALVVLLRRK